LTFAGGLNFSSVSAAGRASSLVDETIRSSRAEVMSTHACASTVGLAAGPKARVDVGLCVDVDVDVFAEDGEAVGFGALLLPEHAVAIATTQIPADAYRTSFTAASLGCSPWVRLAS